MSLAQTLYPSALTRLLSRQETLHYRYRASVLISNPSKNYFWATSDVLLIDMSIHWPCLSMPSINTSSSSKFWNFLHLLSRAVDNFNPALRQLVVQHRNKKEMLRSTHIDCSLSPVISCVFNKTLPGSTEPDAAEQIHLDSAALTRGTYQGFPPPAPNMDLFNVVPWKQPSDVFIYFFIFQMFYVAAYISQKSIKSSGCCYIFGIHVSPAAQVCKHRLSAWHSAAEYFQTL